MTLHILVASSIKSVDPFDHIIHHQVQKLNIPGCLNENEKENSKVGMKALVSKLKDEQDSELLVW